MAPRQIPRATPQGRDQPTPGAIPAFHKGCLDRLSELPQAQLLTKPAQPTDDASAYRHDMARLVADLHALRLAQVLGGHQPEFGLAAYCPTTSRTLDDPHDLQQRRRIGLPPVCQKERERLSARDDLRDECGRRVLATRSEVAP